MLGYITNHPPDVPQFKSLIMQAKFFIHPTMQSVKW